MSHSSNQVKYIRARKLVSAAVKPYLDQPDPYNRIQMHLILTARQQPNLARALQRIAARSIAISATTKKEN